MPKIAGKILAKPGRKSLAIFIIKSVLVIVFGNNSPLALPR